MDKIRITLYNEDGTIKSDRLTQFQGEMYMGPKEEHNGPVRIDVQFNTRDQVEEVIQYIKKLTGQLPISEKRKYVKSTTTQSISSTTGDSILTELKTKQNQVEVIDALRYFNYQFITHEHLEEIFEKNGWTLNLKRENHKEYQFMVRVLRLAKDPKNDKIDPSLIFAIKLIGDLVPGYHVYQGGEFYESVKLPWPKKNINLKVKEKFYKFPATMLYDERAKWRAEDRKVHADPNYQPTPFYNRWLPFVERYQPLNIDKKGS